MAARHYNLLLTGAVQRLTSLFTAPVVGSREDLPFRQLIFSADPANGAAIYVGAAAAVTATDHGFSLDPTQASQQPVAVGPFESGAVKLSDFYVLGTNNERLHILGIPF